MEFKRIINFLLYLQLLGLFVTYSLAQTVISSNKTGQQGGCWYEYWKDGGTGTMTLKDGCNFSCEWGQVNNILFRRGVRPGSRNQVITYSADYKPTGNSYLSVYGWFKNPLVEYYIIESWGTWKPPGNASKGTFESDSGTYDIHQNQRTGPSIEGNKTFTQYWSVRKTKRTSGVITCANHFKAWESKGMTIGSFYEVSFNVEAYQSGGGSADVIVTMDTVPLTAISSESEHWGTKRAALAPGTKGLKHIQVRAGGTQTITFNVPVESYTSVKVYDLFGRQVAVLGGKVYSPGNHSVTFNAKRLTNGVYYYTIGK